MNVLEMAVKQPLNLKIGAKDYFIEFPLSAVIQAETKLGRSLKAPADWYHATATEIPTLLEAGLSRHHPHVTPEEVAAICDGFTPETVDEFAAALAALAFPKWVARYREELAKLEKQATETISPNAQGADAS